MAFNLVVAQYADKIYKGIDFQQADGMGMSLYDGGSSPPDAPLIFTQSIVYTFLLIL